MAVIEVRVLGLPLLCPALVGFLRSKGRAEESLFAEEET